MKLLYIFLHLAFVKADKIFNVEFTIYFTSLAYGMYTDYIKVVGRGLCKPCKNSTSGIC